MASTREELKRTTQKRVVDAAGRLFQERGFAATTVRDIAEASSVSIGTVMAVGDKSALLVRVFDLLVDAEHRRRARTGTASVANGDGTCVSRLSDLVRPFVVLFTGNQDLARAYASILVSGQHASALFTDLAARLVEEFREAITDRGCTPSEDGPAKANGLYLAYIGTLFSWSARGWADPSEIDADLRGTFASICLCKE